MLLSLSVSNELVTANRLGEAWRDLQLSFQVLVGMKEEKSETMLLVATGAQESATRSCLGSSSVCRFFATGLADGWR